MSEFLLIELTDETRQAVEEIVGDLPEGMARTISWAGFEGLVTESLQRGPRQVAGLDFEESLGYIAEPDYDEIPRAARAGWFRNREGRRPLQTQQKRMGFFASKLGG